MKNAISVLLAALVAAAGLGLGLVGLAAAAPDRGSYVPPDDTIVEITGDKADGFTIRHYDGTEISPPTDSEARAECSEYDTVVGRVRCRTEVRTWYRDLGQTKRALNYAQSPKA
jgi:ABC-type sugar transport system substrate-binding protein